MAKGEIIVEGAKCFCSNSVKNNTKATAVPLAVKSQIKKLQANKYFAQDKPIATNLDNNAECFDNGNGFGYCYLTDGKELPCKAKCAIKYKDYYKNVDFHDSMKVLLDISTGACLGYGKTGTITFATTGQKKAVNLIDIRDADPFMVENASSQWEISDPTKKDSVSEITILAPLAEKPTGKYYFIERAVNSGFFPVSKLIIETKLQLKAICKGDPTKVTWAIFKGEGIKDKVKTFVGIGPNIILTLDKLFKDYEEGVYRIEAYANTAGSDKCFILVEYVKDYVEGITAPGKTLVKNTPIPITLKFKASSFAEKLKILNPPNTITETPPIAHWRVTQQNIAPIQNIVIYNSLITTDSNLVKVEIQTGLLGVFMFRNPGEYQIEAYTSPDDPSPVKTTLTVVESLQINTVKGTCSQLLRYNESLKVEVSKFNVDFLPANATKMQWHLQKDGVRLTAFENAAVSKEKNISKPINEILFYDAKGGNNYFGKYVIEAYAKPANKPLFNGSDSFFFEVIKNAVDKITLPKLIPKGAKVKYDAAARIMPLAGDEKINLELPSHVTDNKDGTITFNNEGEFEIAAYLTGEETLNTKAKAKIKVADPELKNALWAYGTGYPRTETGYKEETHAFVEIAGLENQTITIKVWVKGAGKSFYLEPAKYMLEEKKITLNDKGKGSFKITTDDKYREKIKKAIPATPQVPEPTISLVFTLELPSGNQGAVTLPGNLGLKNGDPVPGTKYIEVLNLNEELALTSNKTVKSIFFAKEDSKGVQQSITHQNKTHKIWVHTANMQEDELRVDVMTLVHSDCMEEKEGIITALQSIQEYEEKVGSDGLLELSFIPEEKHLTDAEVNPVRFCIQVSRKVRDPNDFRNNYYVFLEDQLFTMPYPNATVVRSPDMKTIGIKATKQDGSSFTKEEKIEMRKRVICFKNTALIVAKGIATQEAIDHCTVPVMVDLKMAEIEKKDKNGICEAEARVRAFMRMLRVKEDTVGDEGYEKNVGGKSFITDYKKDWSTHPKVSIYIKRIDNSSNAAGAYQFMGKTYDEVIKNYGKRYKITDFNKEAQDKMCLVLMKHYYTQDRPKEFYDTQSENRKEWRKRFKGQQGDIIQFVIDNDIRRAALLSSLCWASLPDSPYGQQSTKYTFADVKTIYDNYLKEELISSSDELYLKKGFLKEFGYDCCTGQSDLQVGSCEECNQDHYDIAKPEHWVHQKPEECWQASIEILANYGLKNNSGYSQNRIIMADQSGDKLIPKETQKALDYIDSQLKIGKPLLVGLDDNLRKGTYNSHKATEHFFVLVGKGCEDGKRFYRFFDVGARSRELGTGKNSRLFLLDNGLLQGKSAGGSHTYTITEVRKNN